MQCQFSETQFSFAITGELMERLRLAGWRAPFFPTQRQENALGYDCRIQGPVKSLFLQFKVPDQKTRSNALHWPDFGMNYYQFALWPADVSPQHNTLLALAADRRNKVFYCAPAFITQREHENFYQARQIASNSVFVPCGSLRPIRGMDEHHICYTLHPRKINMYSRPEEGVALDLEAFEKVLRQAEPYQSLEACTGNLVRTLQSLRIELPGVQESMEARYRQITDWMIAYLGICPLFLTASETEPSPQRDPK